MSLNHNILYKLQSLDPGMMSDEGQLLYPASSGKAELLVAVRPADYSAASVARAVEDCDVHLVNLNLTSVRTPSGDLVVALRVDCAGADAVTRSLERYGYTVIAASGAGVTIDDDEGRRRAAELLHILEI